MVSSSQAELLTFTFFPSSAAILLVVWSANGDCSVLPRPVPKVNLLNDDTYRWDSATVIVTNRARCALNKDILDLLNEENVSGARSGRSSL